MSTSDAAGSPRPLVTEEDEFRAVPRQMRACMMCQQRKVKCNREIPCGNCMRHGSECVRTIPPPPRPKMRKVPRAELKAKIKNYENLLKGHGVSLEGRKDAEGRNRTDANDVHMKDSEENGDETEVEVTAVITGNARPKEALGRKRPASPPRARESTYLENNLWTGQPQHPREVVIQRDSKEEKQHYAEGGALLFGLSQPVPSLTNLHPSPVHIFKLWQTYLDNINPLSKIIHAPTVQRQVLEATGNLGSISKPMEALMFTIYAAAVNSMEDRDCELTLGDHKPRLLARYLTAAQEALVRAGFLKTHDFVVLQAFAIFLLTIREGYNPHALWILTGAAVRICQRLGVHRDGTNLGLSIFETEMRRRLGWQVVSIDSRSAQLSGMGASLTNTIWDAKMPLNVNDSDLSPEMREAPKEYEGLTEMVFCLIRYEFGNFLRDHVGGSGSDCCWENFSSAAESLAEKDRKLEELEQLIEYKYVRRCDPLIPLHALSIAVARTAICKVRLSYHHPKQYTDRGASISQSEKDLIAINALQIIEHDSLGRSMASMKRFLWHINCYFQLDAFVFLLQDLCQRTQGELTKRAWQQVYQVYDNHPNLATDANNPLYFALSNLAVKAWNAIEAEHTRTNSMASPTPYFISLIRNQRRQQLGGNGLPSFRTADYESIQPENEQLRIRGLHSSTPQRHYSPIASLQNRYHHSDIVDPAVAEKQTLMEPNHAFDGRESNEEEQESEDMPPDDGILDWNYWQDLMEANERHICEEGGTKIFI